MSRAQQPYSDNAYADNSYGNSYGNGGDGYNGGYSDEPQYGNNKYGGGNDNSCESKVQLSKSR